jgi:hypothetical protein
MTTIEALNVLSIMDKIECSTNDNNNILKDQFYRATNIQFDPKIRSQIYDLITENSKNNLYTKIIGLFSFHDALLVVMVFVGIVFLFSFIRDIICALGLYVERFLYKIFFNRISLNIQGLFFSLVTILCKAEYFNNSFISFISYFFIFDSITPLFGCFLFYVVATFICIDIFDPMSNKITYKEKIINQNNYDDRIIILLKSTKYNTELYVKELIVCIVWTFAALYHRNQIIGIFVIIMFFKFYCFEYSSGGFGYYFKFNYKNTLVRCLVLSIALNSMMIISEFEFISGNVDQYLNIFGMGIYLPGTLAGSIAILILRNEHYLKFILKNKYNVMFYIFMQFLILIYCLLMVFLGNVLHIISYQIAGVTLFVLWMLDLVGCILQKYKKKSLSIMLFVILINLYLLKQYISWYLIF